MDRIVRINVTKNERNVTLNVVNNVIKIIVSQNSGGGGGGGITTLTSSGGTITITGSPTTKNLELSSSLLALINSALQDAPNNANAYVRSGLSWVIGYTKSAIDTLLGGKANIPTGTPDGTKYLRDDNTWQFLIDATASIKGIAKLYTSLGSNTDGAVDQNTVNTALNLKANLATTTRNFVSCKTLGAVTAGIGSSAYASLYKKLIPAGTITDLDELAIEAKTEALTNNATKTIGFLVNSVDNISTATEIASVGAWVSGSSRMILRREYTQRGTNLRGISTTFSSTTDESASVLATTVNSDVNYAFNPAVDNWIYLGVKGNVSDTFQKTLFEIKITPNLS